MDLSAGVKKLNGVVQNYSWGGYDCIPEMLGIDNMEQLPYAEYWLGAHPAHPSLLEDSLPLDKFIEEYASLSLGEPTVTKFGSLPYLLKVLDVRQMLSIQVHPSAEAARKGFAEENKKGIALKAGHRNYKDENHKPEAMVALGDFWLLHGFKNERAMVTILEKTPELEFLKPVFLEGGYQPLYEKVMHMEAGQVNEILQVLAGRILPLYENDALKKEEADFWAARAMKTYCREGQYDRGIFSIYLFNLLHLKKGESIYQPAGLPHAYLEGQNVEVMANSDNVLRAGLTDKHIDVQELMKHVQFVATEPQVLPLSSSGHTVYPGAAEEFELHRYQWEKESEWILQSASAEIWLLMEGKVRLVAGGSTTELKRGEAVFVFHGTEVFVSVPETATLFRVTVPAR